MDESLNWYTIRLLIKIYLRSLTPERRAATLRKSLLTENAIKQSIKKHVLQYSDNEEKDSYVHNFLNSTSSSEEDGRCCILLNIKKIQYENYIVNIWYHGQS
ncbi:uncharacterized protein LOC117227694 [Megalopta genalis]|uniref:uncharacterized protein LOC117227694 n=1 Tax=Megalopta genalis TaxID=115081 RepID=UPI003FD3E9E5